MHYETENPSAESSSSRRRLKMGSVVTTLAALMSAVAVGWAVIWSPDPEPWHPPRGTGTVMIVPADSGCACEADRAVRLAVRVTVTEAPR
ncbi:hypothetical protein [Nocardia abscessus]|uniref:hypothetical protein n=1 Tax=Nocardia abscessus TaxID=120957 RepID=UPI0024584525|nr:hypothetical protein [Nocardia abscessus]